METIKIKNADGVNVYVKVKGAGTETDPYTTINNIGSDYMLEVPAGNIEGQTSVNKFGANINVPANTREDICDTGGVYPYPTTADITHIAQAVDQVAMRGKAIQIEGLDANWEKVVQDVVLNATSTTTLTALATPLIRIFRMKVQANVVADSDIVVTNALVSITYAKITTDNNQTLMAMYTVPLGYTAYMTKIYGDVIESTGKEPKSTEFNLWVKDNVNNYAFQLKSARGVPKAGAAITNEFKPYLKINEKSDIKTTAYCEEEEGHVHAGFDLILIEN